MADINIPNLPPVIGLTGTEIVPLSQDGTTKRTTTQMIADLANVSDGTVTSVAMTVPNIFSLAGSPITTSGTFALSLATQAANLVWAGPTTGSAALPTFRALVNADIASLGAALSVVDDTNINLTLTGSPNTALVNAAGITVAWAGVLSLARGGTGKELTDPGANKILYWNNTTNESTWLAIGSNLSITDDTLNATGGGGGGNITIGESEIEDGTDTRILYDNAGIVGEYSLTGTGTVVAMQTAPSFLTSITTPRALITQGTITADAPQLSGSVTWNNAGVTFTGWQLSVTATAAAGASKVFDVQIGGGSWFTIRKDGHIGYGASSPSDSFALIGPNASFTEGIFTGYISASSVVSITQGTITADAPQLNGTATWNNGAVNFTAWKLNVTNTASASGSLLLDLQIGGSSCLSVSHFLGGIVSSAYFNASTALQLINNTATLAMGTSADVVLARDAAGALAQRNGTNAQIFNIYNTYSGGGTDYNRLAIWGLGGSSGWLIREQVGGTGVAGGIIYDTPSSANGHQFRISNTSIFAITGTSLLAATDNVYDIGASGANRPRALYLAGAANIGGNVISSGFLAGTFMAFSGGSQITCPSDGVLNLWNSANNNFSRLQFGGTSSSFPALKRSGALLDVRLADDSASTGLLTGDGSALSPSYAFSADPDTGIYHRADHRITFSSSNGLIMEMAGAGLNYISLTSDMHFGWSPSNISAATNDTGLLRAAAGVLKITDGSTGVGNLLMGTFQQFGGTTSSFPALKRSSATLQVRLADDSDYANITAGIATLAIGSKAAPFLAKVGATDTGLYYQSSNMAFSQGNFSVWASINGFQLYSSGRYGWSDSGDAEGTTGATISSGTGDPENAVTANKGSLFLRTDGGTDTTLYTKNSGSGNTGWVAVDNV